MTRGFHTAVLIAVMSLPTAVHAQRPDSQPAHAPSLPNAPDTVRLGMQVRVHVNNVTLAGEVFLLTHDTLFLQTAGKDSPVQTPVPMICITGLERELPHRSMTSWVTSGGAIGAVVGTALGAIIESKSTKSQPSNPAVFVLGWTIGGAGVGAGTGALIGHSKIKNVPVVLPAHTSVDTETLRNTCYDWKPAH